jgi:hypothetical protein
MKLISIMKVLGAVVAGIIGIPLALWPTDFVSISSPQDQCSFGSVQNSEYRRLLASAMSRTPSPWPGLSRGIFWPSDRVFGIPTSGHAERIATHLLQEIKSLNPSEQSPEATVAVAHAVLRSIGAEYDGVIAIPEALSTEVPQRAFVVFDYLIPQRRFAPICLHCFVWSWTKIKVSLKADHGSNEYKLSEVFVLHAGLKYNPQKQKSGNCPPLNARANARARADAIPRARP